MSGREERVECSCTGGSLRLEAKEEEVRRLVSLRRKSEKDKRERSPGWNECDREAGGWEKVLMKKSRDRDLSSFLRSGRRPRTFCDVGARSRGCCCCCVSMRIGVHCGEKRLCPCVYVLCCVCTRSFETGRSRSRWVAQLRDRAADWKKLERWWSSLVLAYGGRAFISAFRSSKEVRQKYAESSEQSEIVWKGGDCRGAP